MSDRSIGVVDILILYENAATRGRDTHFYFFFFLFIFFF